MEKDKSIEFLEYLDKGSDLSQCPFLFNWFKSRLEEISTLQPGQLRQGIAKGDPIPWPNYKRFLALLMVVFPKLSLKKFSEVHAVNYGTVRNWKSSLEFNMFEEELCNEYADLFFKELGLILGEFQPDLIYEHVREIRFYKNLMLVMKIKNLSRKLLKDSIDKLAEDSEGLETAFITLKAFNYIQLAASSAGAVFANPEIHRAYSELLFDSQRNWLSAMVDILIGFIKRGEIETAETIASGIQEQLNQDIMPLLKKYGMSLYDKAHGKTPGDVHKTLRKIIEPR